MGLRTNMLMFMSDKSWKQIGRLMIRIRSVVATKLHTQPSSFRLRSSSNTSSCSEEGYEEDPLANLIKECIFYLVILG
jgi:hypothetical protein